MRIRQDICISCYSCVPFCPVNAIAVIGDRVSLNEDECVECGICLAFARCPVDAIEDVSSLSDEDRYLRSAFSNPLKPHKKTTSTGRGTEEMKTNDVTNRYPPGIFGMAIEVGRPGTGARFRVFETICKALAPLGVTYETANPVYDLMEDPTTGEFKKEYLNVKVLSGVIELIAPLEKLEDVLNVLREIEKDIETVFSVSVISKVTEDNSIPTQKIIENAGVTLRPNGKTNVGLGFVPAKGVCHDA